MYIIIIFSLLQTDTVTEVLKRIFFKLTNITSETSVQQDEKKKRLGLSTINNQLQINLPCN